MTQPAGDVSGKTLGRYRLDSFLGEGGMGRVYRAFDPTLGRPVAIKILPAEVVHNRDRLERFIREARTASSLNHPNVVTIYEIGSEGDTHFIAMELLDGETLRDRGKLDLRRAVDLIAQVADGVAAAHSAGVIHRDLKPENIVITKSGFAKVLDFGLAKLRESPAADDGAATAKKTDPGTVLGSIGYMSPEQATGSEVDHRTDVFSLGCILYEAITGRRAFTGNSSIDTLHKIIHDDPRPLHELAPEAPAESQRIIRKCLAKDPDERYQSAKDLAIDLRNVRRELESQPRGIVAVIAPSRRWQLWIAAAIVVMLTIAAAIMIPRFRRAPAKRFVPMSVKRITASGNVIGAAISPNGEYVAYAYSDAGKQSLFVRQLATGSTLQLVPPSAIGVWGLTFSPDSRSVVYAIKLGTNPAGDLYQIPIFGGTPRRLLARIDSSVTFSPDGKRMAFVRTNAPQAGQSAIIVANADGTGEKVLRAKVSPDFFAPIFWGAPSWSPDGKLIAAPLRSGREFTVIGISVDDGRERSLTRDRWSFVGQVAWLHDQSGLIQVGGDAGTPDRRLWFLSYPDGQRKQITNDLFDYRMVSLTTDDKSLLSVAGDQTSAVWLTQISGNTPPRRLSTGKYDGLQGLAASGDEIVFTSLENGKWDLWSVDHSGNNRRQLTTNDSQAMAPAVSPDGRYVVFAMPRERDWALTRMDRDGSDVKVLCTFVPTAQLASPVVTQDGRWVIFISAPAGGDELWKVPIDGGNPVALSIKGWRPSLSPDGKWVAFGSHAALQVVPLAGGPPLRTFTEISPTTYAMFRWTPDGKALLHNAGLNDRKNIWLQPLDGSPPRQVTHFDDEYILGFDVVPGGKELAVVRGILSRDAVLIKNFH